MATSVSHSSSSLLLEPLPKLDISPLHTTRHALHPIKFVGTLQSGAGFNTDVVNTYNSQAWNPRTIASKLTGNLLAGSVNEERVFVSDERGVQARLEGRAGTALGAVFETENQDLKLGDSKGALPPYLGYKKAPDFVLKTSAHIARVLGEVKVPWIRQHSLGRLVRQFQTRADEEGFRHVLGQVAQYMVESRLMYGFLTTYEETIFLRKIDINRVWVLEYSPVIHYDDRGSTTGMTVSFCQSLYHVGLLALADSDFNTSIGLRNQLWTECL